MKIKNIVYDKRKIKVTIDLWGTEVKIEFEIPDSIINQIVSEIGEPNERDTSKIQNKKNR